jgi:hypothetical protein
MQTLGFYPLVVYPLEQAAKHSYPVVGYKNEAAPSDQQETQ